MRCRRSLCWIYARNEPGMPSTPAPVIIGFIPDHYAVLSANGESTAVVVVGDVVVNYRIRRPYFKPIHRPPSPSLRCIITGNVCSGGGSGFDDTQKGKWWSVNGFEVWAPGSVISNNIANDNDGGGFAIGGQNSIVIGNKAYNNGRARHGYAGFNARINPARGTSASHSVFIGNSSYDQDYGYKEQGSGLSDIKQIGNDYNRNRIGPAKLFASGGQMPISPDMKSKLKALTEDADMPDSARRALREYLDR